MLRGLVVLTAWVSLATSTVRAVTDGRIEYLSPVPGSSMVSPWNNIVIRGMHRIDRGGLEKDLSILVTGSTSGTHAGRLQLSDDSKTLVFTPDAPFALGETVRVELTPRTVSPDMTSVTFEFKTATSDPRRYSSHSNRDLAAEFGAPSASLVSTGTIRNGSAPSTASGSLPPGYPAITLLTSDHPEPGDVFITPFGPFIPAVGRLVILDNLGQPLFYRSFPTLTFDLKPQHGLLTYQVYFKAFAMDSSYALVDSFTMGNGYNVDVHDFQLLPNGHSLLMAYDPEPVRMDTIVAGGNPNAIVTGLILQELDVARNVIFQWRSWDHFSILDGSVSGAVSMTASEIDYVHGNSVELDQDGNILISSRHMNEITKIDRNTGDIVWRLGLNALNNQFLFPNDPRGFSHQHDLRRLPNGHITLFDNGNFLVPSYSRGLEYALDETNHVATLVWEYRHDPDLFGAFMGNVQRHASGGTMIAWGGVTGAVPHVTEIHADGSTAYELEFAPNWHTYRAFRFPWRTNLMVTSAESLDFGGGDVGEVRSLPLSVRNNSAADLTITDLVSSDAAFSASAPVPFTLSPGQSAALSVQFAPAAGGAFSGNLYLRSVHGTKLVAQTVALSGSAQAFVPFTEIGTSLPGVYYSSQAWGDYDNDGDLDVLVTGATASYPDLGPVSRLSRNDGGSFTDLGTALPGVCYGSAAWGDYDNDGDLDLLLAGATGAYPNLAPVSRVYRNDAGSFTDAGAGLPGVSTASVAWGDYDNDGDLDVLLAGWTGVASISRLYRNDGGNFTDANAGLPGVSMGSVAWGDYDNDGDLDILLTGWTGTAPLSRVYRNDGGSFTDIGAGLPGVYFGSVAWGDYDSDGDLDVVMTGWTGTEATSRVYRNDAGTFADLGAGLPGVELGSAAWGDYDDDGDLDLLLTGSTGSEFISRLYRNDSTSFVDIGAEFLGMPGVYQSSGVWGDYDEDGDLDILLTGTASNWEPLTRLYRNNALIRNAPPTAPTNLRGVLGGGTLRLDWDAANDDRTPTGGLTYNLRVGTTPGGSEILSPMAGGTGLRRVVQLGNASHRLTWTLTNPAFLGDSRIYWSVQALDASYAGSAFANERVDVPTGVGELPVPRRFALGANTPNPFNPATAISYDLPVYVRVRLEIFDAKGQRVRTLVDERQSAGSHDVSWDGADDRGRKVGSGVYLYRLTAGSFDKTRRMTLVK
jgi:predicted nucleotidyltransferase